MILSLFCAAVLAGAQPKPADAYAAAIASYADGHFDAAARGLASLSHEEIKTQAAWMVRIATSTPAEQRRALEQRLETAAMLHTDVALQGDLDAGDTFFHINMARLLLSVDRSTLTERSRPDPDAVRRRTFLTRWTAVAAGILLFQGLYQDAIPIVEEAVKLEPTEPRLLLWRGLVLEFRAVWGAGPNSDFHEGLLAGSGVTGTGFDLLKNMAIWRPVEEAYRRVIEVDPNAYEAHVHLGYVLYWQRRFADAKTEYELARDHARDPSVVYVANLLLARLDQDQGDVDAAAADYEHAMTAMPTAQSAYIGLSSLEMRRGDVQHARDLVVRMIAIPERQRQDDPWWSYHGTQVSSIDVAWLRAAVRQ